jgi:hypothetical protein
METTDSEASAADETSSEADTADKSSRASDEASAAEGVGGCAVAESTAAESTKAAAKTAALREGGRCDGQSEDCEWKRTACPHALHPNSCPAQMAKPRGPQPGLPCLRRRRNITLAVLAALLAADAAVVAARWPYTRQRLLEGFERNTRSELRCDRFRRTYFPHPGAVFENVAFARGAVQLAAISTLKIEGSWSDVLTLRHRIDRIRAEGVHVRLPDEVPPATRGDAKKRPETIIGEVVADGAVLEIVRQSRRLRFDFQRLSATDLAKSRQIAVRVTARIPEPPGSLTATAAIGPWSAASVGATPVSGTFDLREANLGRYKGIAGLLSANGSFGGTLARIEFRGETDVPNFQLTQTANTTRLRAAYHVFLNALTGETALDSVRAEFARTVVNARGDITLDGGTRVTVDFASEQARIQDLLRMFGKSPQPALNGPITFRAHTVLPPGREPFLKKLRLDGSFGIEDGQFSRARTQRKVNELSARARGKGKEVAEGVEPASVVSDLKGRVEMRGGIARLSSISLRVPGAVAQGSGTYSLISKQINLSGMLSMQADLPQTTSGIKSILLKPFGWIFDKKKGKGSTVPVRVTGVYPNARFQLSLTGKK